jgi:hypothetical protein
MTFPWLIMQKHTLQPNKKMKEIFFFLNADKEKREKYQQVKTKKNNSGPIVDRKESLQQITH